MFRNRIVHSGDIVKGICFFYKQLEYYYRVTLENILYLLLKKQHFSIYDAMLYLGEQYDQYKTTLEDLNDWSQLAWHEVNKEEVNKFKSTTCELIIDPVGTGW